MFSFFVSAQEGRRVDRMDRIDCNLDPSRQIPISLLFIQPATPEAWLATPKAW
jgi:hypothetical protein